jgi:hypothetical protein
MQESLNASYNGAPVQESSLEDRVRTDDRYVHRQGSLSPFFINSIWTGQ